MIGSLQLVRERCQRPYTAYANCLNSNNLEFRYCRDFQNSFHDCAFYSSPYSPSVFTLVPSVFCCFGSPPLLMGVTGISEADPALGAAVKAWESTPHKPSDNKLY